MKGRRVSPNADGWFDGTLAPGDYVRVAPIRNADGSPVRPEWAKPYYLACSPNGHTANLGRHGITEHEDGTISVTPSIRITTSYDYGKTRVELWHGFLERGWWRQQVP